MEVVYVLTSVYRSEYDGVEVDTRVFLSRENAEKALLEKVEDEKENDDKLFDTKTKEKLENVSIDIWRDGDNNIDSWEAYENGYYMSNSVSYDISKVRVED